MKYSQYIIDAISSINHFDQRHHFKAAMQLKEAALNAHDEQDKHILEILSGVLSMSYNHGEQKYLPHIVWADGSRSFSIEDIQRDDIEILEEVADSAENIWIQVQLSHVVWVLTNNHQYGKQAVSGYIQMFDAAFDPVNWVQCDKAIQSAFQIACKLGKASDAFKQTCRVIDQKLKAMDGTDPLFLSLRLLKLVFKDATKENLSTYLQIADKIAEKNFSVENSNAHLVDETFSVQEMLLRRAKREEGIKTAKIKYASYYEEQAELCSRKEDYFRAVLMLKKACAQYIKDDREKLLELRSRLEELQKKALNKMQAISVEFDAKSTYETIEQMFDGLSLQETIVQLGRVVPLCTVEEVKEQVFDKQKEFVFSSLFSSSILNEMGQTVQELPPLSEVGVGGDSDLLRKHMVRHISEQRNLMGTIMLRFAFRFIQNFGAFAEDDLNFLVYDNAIIPDNRADVIKEGLYLGLSGKLYAAMHILLPQTEHIFRNLVKMCGDTVTFLKEDGTEEYKPLSQIFKSDKLRECYSEDIIFTFQSIMDDPIGENLRNLNAHGVLEPQTGNGAAARCFLCLLIKILALYGVNTLPILRSLAERDPEKLPEQGELLRCEEFIDEVQD